MQIKLNGELRTIDDGSTIGRVLASLSLEPRGVAIEHNGRFLAGEEAKDVQLGSGDTVEIVRFVGGG